MITSKSGQDGSAVSISTVDFESGALPRESTVRPNRLFTADSSIILRTAGHLSATKIEEAVQEIIRLIT